MNKQSPAQPEGLQDSKAGSPTSAAATSGNSRSQFQAVLGPFTVRDLTVFGAGLVLFAASLLPLFAETYNLWNLGSLFSLALGILLPLIVVALFVARRLTPQTGLRIGSLSVDQFASVTASYTLGFFFLAAAASFAPTLLLGLLGALVFFAATVLGRFLPFFSGDFLNRAEVPAHVVARDSAVPAAKPNAPKPAKPDAATAGPDADAASATSGPASTWKAAAAKTAAAVAAVTGKNDADKAAGSDAAGSEAAKRDSVTSSASQSDAGIPAGSAAAPSSSAAPAGPASSATTGAAAAGAAAPAPTMASAVVPPRSEEEKNTAAATADATRQAGPDQGSATPATTVNPQVRRQDPIGATVDPASRAEPDQQPAYEAFWFAVAQPRTAVDPRTGSPAFVIEPGGWVLALEDRGHEFLVQHTDGRVGVLRDLSNIERG